MPQILGDAHTPGEVGIRPAKWARQRGTQQPEVAGLFERRAARRGVLRLKERRPWEDLLAHKLSRNPRKFTLRRARSLGRSNRLGARPPGQETASLQALMCAVFGHLLCSLGRCGWDE